jgi:hypothetical protein
MNLCMAATYDPDPRAPLGFRIPFNAESGEVIEERWRNWRRHDPVNLVAKYRVNLKALRGIYVDCGWRDQCQIQARACRRASPRLASGPGTKSSTTTIPTSTTGWTSACHFSIRRCANRLHRWTLPRNS